jgi:hypothetical protein
VTLIFTANRPEMIWLLADRRITSRNRPPRDHGCDVMFLETADGVAIIGYAGLGATACGSQPADWMSGVQETTSLLEVVESHASHAMQHVEETRKSPAPPPSGEVRAA